MSDEKRPYRKRKRAEDEAQTRDRIAQAAVDLHGSIGPAFTTVSAVAERAGVRRTTVYRHFPDETALFTACSGRWVSQNPLPEIAGLQDIDAGEGRIAAALDLVYPYYRANAQMLGNVIRDAPGSEPLQATLSGFLNWQAELVALLAGGLGAEDGTESRLLRAALAHATSFSAWRELCEDQRLSDEEARRLMCRMLAALTA